MKYKILISTLITLCLIGSVSAICTDSDGGKDFYVKGTLKNGVNTFVDKCFGKENWMPSSYDTTNGKLTEYYCLAYNTRNVVTKCTYGCKSGACNKKPVCGNNKIEWIFNSGSLIESCDDGINNGMSCVPEYGSSCIFCTTSCKWQTNRGDYCGDGIVNPLYEECDDTNRVNDDGCSECIIDKCGDGRLQTGEQCDGTSNCVNCLSIVPPTGNYFILHQNVMEEQFILQDSYVMESTPDKNDGQYRHVYVERNNGAEKRTYQSIDLTKITSNPLYTGSVKQAVLTLLTDGWGYSPIGLYKFDAPWDELTITWNNQPCSTDFSNCNNNLKYIPSYVKTTGLVGIEWKIDITSLVQDALNNGETVLNLAYKHENEYYPSWDAVMIYSKDGNDYCCNWNDPIAKQQTLEVIV